MPGRTPADAFAAFIEPIQAAASCLGSVKIVPSPGGRSAPNQDHAWALNGETGLAFTGGWHFEAQMHYRLVQRPMSGEWRVRTLGYRYRLSLHGSHLWRIHWHPTITSGYHLPHVHLNLAPEGQLNDPMGKHHPTGRMTFEDAIEWVFNMDIDPNRDDWQEVLAQSRELHVRHRSWSTRPPS